MIKKIYLKNDYDIDISSYSTSVVIATYNGEKYIWELLKSIFEQTILPSKIIISDDGSTDKTLDIIDEFKSNNDKNEIITVVYNDSEKHGHVYNFYNACRYVNTDYIFLCDQDDVWIHDKLEIMTKLLVRYKFKALHSNEYYTDKDLVPESYYKYMHRNMKLYNDRDFVNRHMYLINFNFMVKDRFEPNGCCMAIDSDIIKYFNYYVENYPILKPFGHDYIMYYLASLLGTCGFINLPLIYRRIHGENVMGNVAEGINFKKYLLNANNREHYLYKFLKYLNEIVKIKNYKLLRIYSYMSLHIIKWILYAFIKDVLRVITQEENKKVL